MKLFWFLLIKARVTVVGATVVGIAAGVSTAGLIAIINALARPGDHAGLSWAFAVLCAVMVVSTVGSHVLLIRLSQDAVHELRIFLSRRLLSVPLARLEAIGPHRLMAALTEDVTSISLALPDVAALCINGAALLACFVYIAWLSWKVLLVVLLFLAVGLTTYVMVSLGVRRSLRAAREDQDRLFGYLRAIIEGMKELKLNAPRREELLSDDLEGTARSVKGHAIRAEALFAITGSWSKVLFFGLIGVFFLTQDTVVGGDVTRVSAYAFTLLYMMSPLQTIISLLPVYARATTSLEKIEELGLSIDSPDQEGASGTPSPPRADWRRLELLGVRHAYASEHDDGRFVLGPIDLTLERGRLLFIVGGNGSGKSTLAKVLVGLYAPEAGEILLDGEPITDANREWFRHHFSAVFADFFLFDKLYGVSGDVAERARAYLPKLKLESKVRLDGSRLSTTALSQGQRKRLALLSAYLEDRPIYVFDEWAADQDPVFKHLFYTQLLPDLRSRGKTVVVISHDDRYFQVADEIVKLDAGRVAAESTGSFLTRMVSASAPAEKPTSA